MAFPRLRREKLDYTARRDSVGRGGADDLPSGATVDCNRRRLVSCIARIVDDSLVEEEEEEKAH